MYILNKINNDSTLKGVYTIHTFYKNLSFKLYVWVLGIDTCHVKI